MAFPDNPKGRIHADNYCRHVRCATREAASALPLRSPRQKFGRLHSGVAQDFGQNTATEGFAFVLGNGGGSTVRVPKESVAAPLSRLHKAERFKKANDLAGPHGM